MPEPPGDSGRELHLGELVPVPRAKVKRAVIRQRLLALLEPLAPDGGFVSVAVPFRPVPEFDLRSADVAWVSPAHWPAALAQDDIMGAPDLVIGVRSPGNTDRELNQKRMFYLTHGCREFWIVDADQRRVDNTQADSTTMSRHPGDRVEVSPFGPGASVAVSDIFEI